MHQYQKYQKAVEGPDRRIQAAALAFALSVGIILLIALCVWASSSESPSNKSASQSVTAPVPTPTYEAEVSSPVVIDPATLVVHIHVKNTGTVSGTPSCGVRAQSVSGTYKGIDNFTPGKTLAPNEEYEFNAQLTITKEGAAYVTEAGAHCT